jgi:hypothetical protein
MLDLRRNAGRYARLRPEQAVALLVRQYAKRDVSADIARYIIGGETIPTPSDAFGSRVKMTTKTVRASNGEQQTIPQFSPSPL